MTRNTKTIAGWLALGLALTGAAAALAIASPLFGYDFAVIDMPVLPLTFGMIVSGLLFLALLRLIPSSEDLDRMAGRSLLWVMLAAGLAMRLTMLASEPVLEDDYQRYLWDGAVTAHGLNPYAILPEAAKAADPASTALGRLAVESGPVLGRVNHPRLRTVYPPAAQAMFALSHALGPWSLTAWRAVIMVLDLASVVLILLLLREVGRSPLWAAFYWWNPIVVKELFNAAHMEALVLPLVLGGLLLAVRERSLAATGVLTLAAGAKIWPVILLPLVWRPLLDTPRGLALAVSIATMGCALFAWPILSAGLDSTSGFMAFASKWKTNSALFPLIEGMTTPAVARALVVAALAAVILWQCRTAPRDAEDILGKAFVIVAALFLLSPAQFPWYYLWVLPLLCLFPIPGLLVLTATLPLYYTAFYFLPRGTYETFSHGIVWVIWLPAWGLLAWQARSRIAAPASLRHRRTA